MAASASTTASLATGLEGRALACRRGRRLLFEGVDIRLAPGTITWLRGTNGSGKTSLMRILAGLSTPEAGELLWNGRPLRAAGTEAREAIVYIGHANALKDDLTLRESLAFLGRLSGVADADTRAGAALAAAGLADRAGAAVRTLSQGQRRRGALARLALDETPRTWILDEPYDALDAQSTARLSELLLAHAARGGAVLLTSHQVVELAGALQYDLETRRAQPSRRAAASV
ncbi:cytochrome c biogenesis heme-transporting ATPase CcmA [Rubrivivax gelatinosus]|uniref:Heme ABC exporter ATP-binding protein CcmA n=1 Tax=Rubrivivax gelatinosus TaxID=28068 RepID=A0ABS1DYM1_RUBGE|nr:heme ABC exporter ATP-binding protein CcmA [Rubrivivax gelatinosus]